MRPAILLLPTGNWVASCLQIQVSPARHPSWGGGAGACWRCRQRIAFPRTGQRPGTMGFGAAGLVKPRTWVAARGPGLATL